MNVNSSMISSNLTNSISSTLGHLRFQETLPDEVDAAKKYVQALDFKHSLNFNGNLLMSP